MTPVEVYQSLRLRYRPDGEKSHGFNVEAPVHPAVSGYRRSITFMERFGSLYCTNFFPHGYYPDENQLAQSRLAAPRLGAISALASLNYIACINPELRTRKFVWDDPSDEANAFLAKVRLRLATTIFGRITVGGACERLEEYVTKHGIEVNPVRLRAAVIDAQQLVRVSG